MTAPDWYGRKAPLATPLTGLLLHIGCKTGWLVAPHYRPSPVLEVLWGLAAVALLAIFGWWWMADPSPADLLWRGSLPFLGAWRTGEEQ
jgi:hypothetical protein